MSSDPQPAEPIAMVAIDLDGTLLRTDKRISRRTLGAIAAVRERGVRIVLATARPPRSVREFYERLQLDTLTINYNGALIYNPADRRTVMHRPLPVPLARQVVDTARDVDPKVAVSVEVLDRWYTDWVDPTMQTETARQFEPDFVGPLKVFLNQPITKLMLLAPPERLKPVRRRIEHVYRDRIGIAVSDPHLIQILHPAVSKATGLAHVAQACEIPAPRIMAIGDAPNDAPMLAWAGFGVAVANAWPETIAAADATVAGNDEEGVAEALERFILQRGK